MKNLTIKTAIKLGFNFENSDFETKEEFEKEIIEFLFENSNKLKRVNEECEVTGSGNRQYVSHGDYESSGEIITYGYDFWRTRKGTRIYHSQFMRIEDDGQPVSVNLYFKMVKTNFN